MSSTPLTHRKLKYLFDWLWSNKVTIGLLPMGSTLTFTREDGSAASITPAIAALVDDCDIHRDLIETLRPLTAKERAALRRRAREEDRSHTPAAEAAREPSGGSDDVKEKPVFF